MGRREQPTLGEKQSYESFIHEGGKKSRYHTPVVFAPGLGETAEGSFKKPVQALARLGHDVYAVTQPTTKADENFLKKEKARLAYAWKQKYGDKISAKNADKLFDSIPLTEFRKAQALIEFIKNEVQPRSPGRKVDIIGHSQGGANALIAAFLEPELFKHVVLVNPAGQSGQESKGALVRKFHLNLGAELLKHPFSRHVRDTIYTLVFKRMYLQAIQEGRALAGFDAFPFLDALGRIAPEVTKKTYFDKDDGIFRAQKIKRAVAIAQGKGNTLLGEHEETKNGEGHYNLVANSKDYAVLFHQYLTKPEQTTPQRKAA